MKSLAASVRRPAAEWRWLIEDDEEGDERLVGWPIDWPAATAIEGSLKHRTADERIDQHAEKVTWRTLQDTDSVPRNGTNEKGNKDERIEHGL